MTPHPPISRRPPRGSRVESLSRELDQHPTPTVDAPLLVGRVAITGIRCVPVEGVWCVEVDTSDDARPSPHYRIFNPPALVEDPSGTIRHAGRTWRVDPLAALAATIATHRAGAKR
jgi:hypothetical protein